MSLQTFVVAFAFGVLTTFGVVVTLSEGRAIFSMGISDQERVDALAASLLQPGFSSMSQDAVLDECFDLIPSLVVKVQPSLVRASLLDSCETIARSVAEVAPVNANAQVILALVDLEHGRTAEFNDHLVQAQLLAPDEGWLIYRRVALAMPNESLLSPKGEVAYDADLGAMVTSQWGVGLIAERYANEPGFRVKITGIVEKLPQAAQARFLARVRGAVAHKSAA